MSSLWGLSNYAVQEGSLVQTGPNQYQVSGNTHVTGDFDIGAGEHVVISGMNNAQLLWNDQSGQASQIMGSLSLNDVIFALINQAGIDIGASGLIEAQKAAVFLSTLNINPQDFFDQHYHFLSEDGAAGRIVNYGEIDADDFVAIIGEMIENDGAIIADMGQIILASGEEVTLTMGEEGLIGVIVDRGLSEELDLSAQSEAQVINSGIISSGGGGQVLISASAMKGLYQKTVYHSGELVASSLSEQGGRIVLSAVGGDIHVAEDAVIDVSAAEEYAQRGSIDIDSDDAVHIYGTARIQGNAENNSDGAYIVIDGHGQGRGVAFEDTGGVFIYEEAQVTARGAEENSQAGRIFINSYHNIEDREQENPGLQGTVGWVGDHAVLDASGGDHVDGGWVDLSGQWIDWHRNGPVILTENNQGLGGQITFDPLNVTISNGADTNTTGFTPGVDEWEELGDDAGLNSVFDVTPGTGSFHGLASGDIFIDATGTITVSADWNLDASIDNDDTDNDTVGLRLYAGEDIEIDAIIDTDGGAGDFDFRAEDDIIFTANGGLIGGGGSITLIANSGDVGADGPSGDGAIDIDGAATLDAGGGNITLQAENDIEAGDLITTGGAVDIDTVNGDIRIDSITTTTGSIDVYAQGDESLDLGDASVASVVTSTGHMTIYGDRSAVVGQMTTTSGNLVADGDRDVDGLVNPIGYFTISSAPFNMGSGTVDIISGGPFRGGEFTTTSAAANAISIVSGGSITVAEFNVANGTVVLSSQGDIENVEVNASELDLTIASATDVTITSTGDIDILAFDNSANPDANLTFNAGGAFTITPSLSVTTGNVDIDAVGEILFAGLVTSSGGTISATSSTDTVVFDNAVTLGNGSLDVDTVTDIAISQAISSTGGNMSFTSSAGQVVVDFGTALTTTSGIIDIDGSSDVVLSGTIDAGSGDVDLTSSGSVVVLDFGSSITTTSGTVDVDAAGDLGASGAIETDSGNIELTSTGSQVVLDAGGSTTTASGAIDIDASADVVIGHVITAGSGDVDITSTGSLVVLDFGSGVTTTSGAVDIDSAAETIIGSTIETNSGNIEITSTGSFVTLDFGSGLTTTSGVVDIDAAGDLIVTSTITAGTGDVDLTSTGSFVILDAGSEISTTSGTVDMDAAAEVNISGSITTGSGGIEATSTGSFVSEGFGSAITTTTGYLDFDAAAEVLLDGTLSITNGNISLASSGSFVNANVALVSGTGFIDIDAAGEILLNEAVQSTTGNITVDGGDAITFDGSLDSGSGNISIQGAGEVELNSSVSTTGGDLTVTSTGAGVSFGDTVSTGAGSIIVSSVGAIFAASEIDTTDGDVSLSSSTDIVQFDADITTENGSVTIHSIGGMDVENDIQTTGGDVIVTSTGAMQVDGTIITETGSISLTAAGLVDINNLMQTTSGNINVESTGSSVTLLFDTASDTGNMSFSAQTGVGIDANITITNGNLTVTSATDAITSFGIISTGNGTIDMDAVGNIEINETLTTTGGNLDLNSSGGSVFVLASLATGAGDLIIDSQGDLDIRSDISTTGGLSLTSQAGIDITGGTSDLTSGSGTISVNAVDNFTTAAAINSTSGDVSLQVSGGTISVAGAIDAGSGNVDIDASGTVSFLQIATTSADDAAINVVAGDGGITDSNGAAVNLSAPNGRVTLLYSSSIGTSGDRIEFEAAGIHLTSSFGNIFISEADGASYFNLQALGQIAVDDLGPLVIEESGSVFSSITGPFTLTNGGVNDQEFTINHSMESSIGDIAITAGSVTLSADADLDASNGTLQITAADGAITFAGSTLEGRTVDFNGPILLAGIAGSTTSIEGTNGIDFSSTIDGNRHLTIDGNFADITFNGAVGGTTALADVFIANAQNVSVGDVSAESFIQQTGSGTTTLEGSYILTNQFGVSTGDIEAAGVSIQTDGANVFFGSDITLSGSDLIIDTGAGAGNVRFIGTIDGLQPIQITAGLGDIQFDGDVGSVDIINGLTINSANDVLFNGDFDSVNNFTQLAGTGETVFSQGGLSFGFDFTGNDLQILARYDNPTTDVMDINNSGTFLLDNGSLINSFGAFSQIGTGAVILNGDINTAVGDGISFASAVTLEGDVTLDAAAGAIALASETIDGHFELSLSAPGDIVIDASIGTIEALSGLSILEANAVDLNSDVVADAISLENVSETIETEALTANGGDIDLQADQIAVTGSIETSGNVSIVAASSFVQTGGEISSNRLTLEGSGDFTVTTAIRELAINLTEAGNVVLVEQDGVSIVSATISEGELDLTAQGDVDFSTLDINGNVSIETEGYINRNGGGTVNAHEGELQLLPGEGKALGKTSNPLVVEGSSLLIDDGEAGVVVANLTSSSISFEDITYDDGGTLQGIVILNGRGHGPFVYDFLGIQETSQEMADQTSGLRTEENLLEQDDEGEDRLIETVLVQDVPLYDSYVSSYDVVMDEVHDWEDGPQLLKTI